ncbi:hypothetical protein BH18ACI5_BH18ACI5_05700 [soil metagenome]
MSEAPTVARSRSRITGLGMLGSLLAVALIYSTWPVDPMPRIDADAHTSAPSQPGILVVTYIANEGVLIASGDKQILIDGLHRRYQRGYPYLPEPHREKIETAAPPFDGIDLVLVSHLHLDHFHPESVGRHLQHNPQARLVSSQQVVGEVEKPFKDYAMIKSRVTTATPRLTQRIAMNIAGIDVAFLPMWFLTGEQGRDVVRDHIKPRQIVAVHMPASGADRAAAEIKQHFPDAVTFTTLLEKRTY